MNEGYIKFECERIDEISITDDMIFELNETRTKLYDQGLIGITDGIGFGNISIRNGSAFIISGTQTGGIRELTVNDYVEVIESDLINNKIICKGRINASSESLTHAVVYECSREINSVIHVHNEKLWNSILNRVPTTDPENEFGQ